MIAPPFRPRIASGVDNVPGQAGYRRRSLKGPTGRPGRRFAAAAAAVVLCSACTASPNDGAAEAETTSSPSPSASPASAASAASEVPGASVDWASVADEAEPSVVSISVSGEAGSGQGSGVVINDDGHVLTNNHVVAPAVAGGQIQVALSDARVFEAAVVGADPDTDLAVVQIQAAPDDLTALEFGDSDTVEVGQPVMALGNPLGLSNTVTVGIVSALDRPVTTQNASSTPGDAADPVVTNAIQTDAAVNPGNSGGALVDDAGLLVGINSSIATLGASEGGQGGSIGLGFAIPANQARRTAEQLIETGTATYPIIGVLLEQDYQGEGVQVATQAQGDQVPVTEGGPAANAGIRPGDVIVAIDGRPVTEPDELIVTIRAKAPGDATVLRVRSGDDEREVRVVLDEATSD